MRPFALVALVPLATALACGIDARDPAGDLDGGEALADAELATDAAEAVVDSGGQDVPDGSAVEVVDAGVPVDVGTPGADAAAAGADASQRPDAGPAGDTGPWSARQTARVLGTFTGQTHGYYEYLPPQYDGVQAVPLLLFWHGVGENGAGNATELPKVLNNGPPKLIHQNKWAAERPFVVLSPQHPGSGCPTATEIDGFLDFARQQYRLDPARLYLTGLSCGAIGSWNYLGTYANEAIAAAVLIAGDGRSAWNKQKCDLGKLAVWGLHGDADKTVLPVGTTEPMNNLLACPSPPRLEAVLTIYPGVGHDSWTRTYDLSAGHDVYSWLLKFKK